MRLRKLGPALLAATSLLALAPAAASAHKHPSPRGRCAINIRVAERQITAGEQVEVKGQPRVRPAARAPAVKPVTLYEYVAGTAGYVPVQSTTTERAASMNSSLRRRARTPASTSARTARRVAASGPGRRPGDARPGRPKAARSKPGRRTGRRSAARSARHGRRRRARDPAAPERRHRRRMASDRLRPGRSGRRPTRSPHTSACPATRAFACSCAATGSTARAPRLRWSTRSPRRRTRA